MKIKRIIANTDANTDANIDTNIYDICLENL